MGLLEVKSQRFDTLATSRGLEGNTGKKAFNYIENRFNIFTKCKLTAQKFIPNHCSFTQILTKLVELRMCNLNVTEKESSYGDKSRAKGGEPSQRISIYKPPLGLDIGYSKMLP